MPIRAEVGLEMVLNMGERREERRLWRLGGIVGVFCCFCMGYEDLDKCAERRATSDETSETTTEEKRKIPRHQVPGGFPINNERVRQA